MELKIIKILENEEKSKILTEITGCCLINLIVNKISNNEIKLDDDSIVNFEFFEYDYIKENKRLSNKQYIDYADYFVKNLK